MTRRRPGPAPTRPCGTNAAYHRHLKNGEVPDDACLAAHSEYTSRRRDPAAHAAYLRAYDRATSTLRARFRDEFAEMLAAERERERVP